VSRNYDLETWNLNQYQELIHIAQCVLRATGRSNEVEMTSRQTHGQRQMSRHKTTGGSVPNLSLLKRDTCVLPGKNCAKVSCSVANEKVVLKSTEI
jgi:hypothetical protein